MSAAPYPANLEAKGWMLPLDYERVEQSDTWALSSPEQRPWLLMIWMMAWRQVPIASLPTDHKLIAARIGMPIPQFSAWADILLRGWTVCDDGRMYHDVLTEFVLNMASKREKDRKRVADYRRASNSGVTCYTRATSTIPTCDYSVSTTPEPIPIPVEKNSLYVKAGALTLRQKKTDGLPTLDYDALVTAYHEACPDSPKATLRTATRDKLATKFWQWILTSTRSDGTKRAQTADEARKYAMSYFQRAAQNNWLMNGPGDGAHKNWRADFDFLLTEKGRVHVIEKTQS